MGWSQAIGAVLKLHGFRTWAASFFCVWNFDFELKTKSQWQRVASLHDPSPNWILEPHSCPIWGFFCLHDQKNQITIQKAPDTSTHAKRKLQKYSKCKKLQKRRLKGKLQNHSTTRRVSLEVRVTSGSGVAWGRRFESVTRRLFLGV